MAGIGPRGRWARLRALSIALVLAVVACGGDDNDGDAGGDDGDGDGATVSGAVTIGGEPVEGRPVSLELVEEGADPTAGGEPVDATETDADGGYSFGGVDDGDYVVIVDLGDIPNGGSSCSLFTITHIEGGAARVLDFEVPEAYVPRASVDLLIGGPIISCG